VSDQHYPLKEYPLKKIFTKVKKGTSEENRPLDSQGRQDKSVRINLL